MSKKLTKFIRKVKKDVGKQEKEIVVSLVILAVALVSFQLGKMVGGNLSKTSALPEITWQPLSALLSSPTIVPVEVFNPVLEKSPPVKQTSWSVIASKNSNKYHFSWCPGAKQIVEKNKIIFSSEREAQAAGYVLAGNCQR